MPASSHSCVNTASVSSTNSCMSSGARSSLICPDSSDDICCISATRRRRRCTSRPINCAVSCRASGFEIRSSANASLKPCTAVNGVARSCAILAMSSRRITSCCLSSLTSDSIVSAIALNVSASCPNSSCVFGTATRSVYLPRFICSAATVRASTGRVSKRVINRLKMITTAETMMPLTRIASLTGRKNVFGSYSGCDKSKAPTTFPSYLIGLLIYKDENVLSPLDTCR